MVLTGTRVLLVEQRSDLRSVWGAALLALGSEVDERERSGAGLEAVLLGAASPRSHHVVVLGPGVTPPMRDAFRHTLVGALRHCQLVLVDADSAAPPHRTARGMQVGIDHPDGIQRAVLLALGRDAPDGSSETSPRVAILLAEDNPVNQEVAELALQAAGFTVHPVVNGLEAVNSVKRRTYDAIVMDIQMPTMDGLTATRMIRSLPSPKGSIPVVAMTANVLPSHREAAAAAGMDGFVEKPITPDHLISTIRTAMQRESDFRTSPERAHPQPDIIDLDVLNQLKDTFGPALRRVQATLATDAPQRVDRMVAAVPVSDFETIRREAHSLKSSTGTFGLVRLATLAREIEQACTDGHTDDALSALRLLVEHLQPDLRQLDHHMR